MLFVDLVSIVKNWCMIFVPLFHWESKPVLFHISCLFLQLQWYGVLLEWLSQILMAKKKRGQIRRKRNPRKKLVSFLYWCLKLPSLKCTISIGTLKSDLICPLFLKCQIGNTFWRSEYKGTVYEDQKWNYNRLKRKFSFDIF